MLKHKEITSQISVSAAIDASDLHNAKELGFRTIINNLPDEEVTNGFTSKTAHKLADELGLNYIYQPVTGATVSDQEQIDQFASSIDYHAGPVLVHCKSGIRSAILYGLAASRHTSPETIIDLLEQSGFEVDYLEDEFEEQYELAQDNKQTISA